MEKETIKLATRDDIEIHLYKEPDGKLMLDIPQARKGTNLPMEPLPVGTDLGIAIELFEQAVKFSEAFFVPMFLYEMVKNLVFKEIFGISQPIVAREFSLIKAISPGE